MTTRQGLLCLMLSLALCACQATSQRLRLQIAHQQALKQHKYISDQQQYGVREYWTPSLNGDCEDYALWMKQKVGGQLLYVRTPQNILHIVLSVDGWVIDNTSPAIYRLENMPHKLIFTMSERNIESYLAYSQKQQLLPSSAAHSE